MIIVRIIGGLGNQMFQYAVGRHLAIKNNTELKLDISAFEWYKPHIYGLDNFNINATIATKEETDALAKYGWLKHLLRNILDIAIPYYERKYIRQREHSFDPNILKAGKNTYLAGYFGSEKYFIDVADTIRTDFTLKNKPDGNTLETARQIRNTNSVSLHIRRGDYIGIGVVLPLEYYYTAISEICKHITNPHFFIFSDDIKWAKANLHLPHPTTFVESNGVEKNYNDIYLMSLCKGNIIANSTFSWWGAWLNPDKDKVVVAPKEWFNVSPETRTIIKDANPVSWYEI